MVATDYLSKYSFAKALTSKTKEAVSKFIVNEIIFKFGPPKEFRTDHGREFENELLEEISKFWNIKLSRSPPYHPESNGLVERTNQSLLLKLAKLVAGSIDYWDVYLPLAIFMYNISPIAIYKRSPFEIMFGRKPTLDFKAKIQELTEIEKLIIGDLYEESRKLREQDLKEIISKKNRKLNERNETKPRSNDLKENCVVLRRNLTPEKLQKKWIGPYIVKENFNNGIYEIKSIENGKIYTIHRDDLVELVNVDAKEILPEL